MKESQEEHHHFYIAKAVPSIPRREEDVKCQCLQGERRESGKTTTLRLRELKAEQLGQSVSIECLVSVGKVVGKQERWGNERAGGKQAK